MTSMGCSDLAGQDHGRQATWAQLHTVHVVRLDLKGILNPTKLSKSRLSKLASSTIILVSQPTDTRDALSLQEVECIKHSL